MSEIHHITFTGSLPEAATSPAPTIEAFLPAKRAPLDESMIILPGGGYGHLADHEGEGYARFFSQFGLACFVVKYRLGTEGHRHPAMLEDALAAIHAVRQRAEEFELDTNKLGIVGSSAGGHLAAHALTAHTTVQPDGSLCPAFGVLCYPVIDMSSNSRHAGSCSNLLGPEPTGDALKAVSPHLHVTAKTPPCFIWHTAEDLSVPVENSLLFANAMRQAGVPCDLHVYAKGRHGLGLNAPFPWADECVRWLRQLRD